MRLATFDDGAGARIGIVGEETVLDLSRAVPALPTDMRAFIAGGDTLFGQAREALAAGDVAAELALGDVTLCAPIARPGKIFAIGLNYADHIAESGLEKPEEQVWFTKAQTAINGPYDPIEVPKTSPYVDYEVELVAVIGRGGKHISEAEAPGHVFGYCVGNDVTERLWQHRTPQWSLGKSFDTHAPIGPWITTADEVPDPHGLDIRCSVNGEVRQSSNTRHLHFNLWQQIAHLSSAMTLEPGDLIFTGTPGGVGAAMDPRVFLQPGDRVRCEVERLGFIEGEMVAETERTPRQ